METEKSIESISISSKNEIAALKCGIDCCKAAFLSALIHTGGSLIISSEGIKVAFSSSIPKVLAATRRYAEEYFPCVEESGDELIFSGGDTIGTLFALGILKRCESGMTVAAGIERVITGECCAVNYIRGAFLACGSLSMKRGYQISFTLTTGALASDLMSLLSRHGIEAKRMTRGEKVIVYVKDSQAVSDCLALMGADGAVLKLNDSYVMRQVKRDEQRRTNCDLANIAKTVNAAVRQVADIEYIDSRVGLEVLDEKLLTVARGRLAEPEISFSALADKLGLSKSTLKNRLNKIAEYAARLREKENSN